MYIKWVTPYHPKPRSNAIVKDGLMFVSTTPFLLSSFTMLSWKIRLFLKTTHLNFSVDVCFFQNENTIQIHIKRCFKLQWDLNLWREVSLNALFWHFIFLQCANYVQKTPNIQYRERYICQAIKMADGC